MGLEQLQTAVGSGIDAIQGGISNVVGFVKENPIGTSIGVGAVGAGLVVGGLALAGRKRKAKTRKGRSRDRKFISKERHEKAYQRRRRKLRKKTYGKYYKRKGRKRSGRVYYARKTGQPYILLASGKAKFIKGKRRNK